MAEIDISEAKIFFACGALWDACGGQLTPHGITYGTALGDGDGPNMQHTVPRQTATQRQAISRGFAFGRNVQATCESPSERIEPHLLFPWGGQPSEIHTPPFLDLSFIFELHFWAFFELYLTLLSFI